MNANSGWQTLVLITSVQLALLLAGILVLFSWFASRNVDAAKTQAHSDNLAVSEQVASAISRLELVVVGEFSEADCTQVRHVFGKYQLVNPGFVSLVDPKNGTVVCCVSKSNKSIGNDVFAGISFVDGESFYIDIQDRPYCANVTYLSSIDACLIAAQQPCSAFAAVGEEIDFARNVCFSWILFGGLLFLCATLVALNWTAAKFEFKSEGLQREIAEREIQIEKTQGAVMFGLAKLAESRDNDTGEHLERIRSYVTILANDLRANFTELVGDGLVEVLAVASTLHDIGKVGIPDSILLKPGRLSKAERNVMELHTSIGGECLEAIQKHLGGENLFMEMAKQVAYYHHERWDGAGYPCKLKGEGIPLVARIVAVADVYDALTSKRPYKDPFSHLESRGIILSGSGSQFDPEVVAAFLRHEDKFEAISVSQKTLSPNEIRSEFQQLCERTEHLVQQDRPKPFNVGQN